MYIDWENSVIFYEIKNMSYVITKQSNIYLKHF